MCCHSKIFLLNHRFSCVPVDFEVVNVNSSSTSEDDIKNAIMAIRRNGVALKGLCIQLLIDSYNCSSIISEFLFNKLFIFNHFHLFFLREHRDQPHNAP